MIGLNELGHSRINAWININVDLENGGQKTFIDGMKDTQINGIIILDSSLPEIGITNKRKPMIWNYSMVEILFYGGDINMNSKFQIYTCIWIYIVGI